MFLYGKYMTEAIFHGCKTPELVTTLPTLPSSICW